MRLAVNALTLPRNLAGIGFSTQKLYQAMAEAGEVELICIYTNAEAAPFFKDLHPKIKVRDYRLRGVFFKVIFSQIVFPILVRRFDLVHSVGNVASVACSTPQVVTINDLCHKILPERFGFAKRSYLNFGFSLSVHIRKSRFICISANTERDFFRFYPTARGRSTVIPLASKFGINRTPGQRAGLLWVGTLEPGKNLALACRSLAALKRKYGLTLSMQIVGARGWKQSDLPDLVERLGISDQVNFLGYVSDAELKGLYKRSLCLLFSSRYEGFGFPILEAQSQGCIVVAADNSCMREVGGDAALYFTNDNEDSAAECVREIVSNSESERVLDLRERGYENSARFSWERTGEASLQVFKNVLKESA